MSELDRFIREHREEFDTHEPGEGHLLRFENRLEQPEEAPLSPNRWVMLRIAALILLMITVSVFVFDFASREIRERYAGGKPGTELPVEISEAMQYYDRQVHSQMGTLHALAASSGVDVMVGESARKEIRNLDAATAELTKLLAGNPGNEQILDAIIRNQQMKQSVLNTIIDQVTKTK